MSRYKMRVHVEMIPCDEVPTEIPVKANDGSVSMVLSEADAISIDACEKALLETTYPILRETLASHLSAIAKKKACEQEGTVVCNTRPYRIDGELGRIEFSTYQVCQDDTIQYDTARELFTPLGCWERYQTIGFKELAFMYGMTERSSRKTETFINRIRYQEGATGSTTLRTSAEREGKQVMACLERTTTAILQEEGFDEIGQPLTSMPFGKRKAMVMPAEQVKEAIDACELSAEERAEVERNPVLYEQATDTVNISVDDVVVKKQKPHRIGEHERDEMNHDEATSSGRKYVHNTIAHVQHQDQSYCITGLGVPAVLRVLLGYLLANVLLGHRLQFFVDGQKTLQASILRAFSWLSNLGMILDWYHLEDKCKRQLSLAMTGRKLRNELLNELKQVLWYGRVDHGIQVLQKVPEAHLKNSDEIRILIGYLERHRPYIPCYEVRKRLGLRNSSNRGEKMNDLLVSDRQKHNGMSWSASGSSALAALEALKRNNTYQHWFEYHEIPLKQAA
jgi:hypothetical protein